MQNLINLINSKLDEYLQINYPSDLFKAMKYTLELPGKRLRPVMCIETTNILGGNIDVILPAACAIEMLHVHSLILDDLPCMDNDDYRRGQLANHKVFGEANAVLAADALLTYAPQLIIEKSNGLSDKQLIRILYEYTKFAGAYGLDAGQVVDIESEGGKLIKSKEETLNFIHLNKTAALFRLALKTGAIGADADEKIINEFDELGIKFGLAFQIYDDIMDTISSFEELGKTIGKDENSQKLTYVSLYGLDNAKNKFKNLINECYDIINNYDSKILNEIIQKLDKRIAKG